MTTRANVKQRIRLRMQIRRKLNMQSLQSVIHAELGRFCWGAEGVIEEYEPLN